jgi:hypothetical protein
VEDLGGIFWARVSFCRESAKETLGNKDKIKLASAPIMSVPK